MTPSVPSRLLLSGAVLIASVGVALGADDGVPRVLLDRELNATQVNLTSIGEGQVRWLDAAGRERSRAIDELLAVIDPDGGLLLPGVRRQVIESLGFPVVETTDGQRLLARLRDDPAGSDEFVELLLVGGQKLAERSKELGCLPHDARQIAYHGTWQSMSSTPSRHRRPNTCEC